MRNAVEPVCNMITLNENLSNLFYVKSLTLVIDLMEVIVSDQSLVLDYISNLRKLMIIPKKLTDSNFCEDLEIKGCLLQLMKLNLLMLRDMFEFLNKKEGNFSRYSKEYQDFIRNSVVKK